MLFSDPPAFTSFKSDIRQLFYQRTHVSLWLGVVFFSLFSILDYTCCRDNFTRFFSYRLAFVAILLCFLNLLRLKFFKPFTPYFMSAAMLLGALVISLMSVDLGGFYSGYYVGILLMITGALSVLPLRGAQAAIAGVTLYAVYFLTVILGTDDLLATHMNYSINNSFYFLSIVGIAAVQSHDEMKMLLKELAAKKNIQRIRQKLSAHTNGLEINVQQRLAILEESTLRYADLYNTILDLIVLIDARGVIQKINQYCSVVTGNRPSDLVGRHITSLLQPTDEDAEWLEKLQNLLDEKPLVEGLQLHLRTVDGNMLEVEMSASVVEIEDEPRCFQLILRDISTNKTMERQLLESQRLIGTSRQTAIFGLARLAECRDDDTGLHLVRIRAYACLLCRELAKCKAFQETITKSFVDDILHSSVLHDIGKVGIPDAILLKPSKLTKEEFEHMKQHCIFGSDTLSTADNDGTISFLQLGREIARSHHERWDGSGYPDGLSGEAIPLSARIIAVTDVYDALTSTRVYKHAFDHETATRMIFEQSVKQFDPRIVQAFLRVEHLFKEARLKQAMNNTISF